MSRHLLIRADANAKIGTGHVMRCLALAQAWQDNGGTVSLAARELPEAMKARLSSEQVDVVPVPAGSEAEDAANLVSLAKEKTECVVVDGYAFGIAHQRALREAGIRQLFIDDYGHAQEYIADFVLNQNITADESLYRNRAENTQLLLGTKFAMLRREFRKFKNWNREIAPKATRVMVTMGGADPDNATLSILTSILTRFYGRLQIRAVVGPANSNRASLEEFQKQTQCIELLQDPDMPELMKWADLGISAAGSTCLELFFLQLPFVAIPIADNQVENARKLHGLVQVAEDTTEPDFSQLVASALTYESRVTFLQRSRQIVDGLGTDRIVEYLSIVEN